MKKNPDGRRLGLILSILIPFIALGVQWVLWPYITPFVWFLFFPAVFFSARLGGLKGGLASTLLSTVIVWYFFISPQLSWEVANPSNLWSVGLFLIMGYLFSDSQEHLNAANQRTKVTLRETEEHNRTTLYSIGDCVITTDSGSQILQVNPAAEKITGWSEAEAMGKPISDVFRIVNEDTRREVENPVARVLREGVVVGLANHSLLIARDGLEYPIADSGAPIRNLQGEITGVVLVFHDQTSERYAENALRESERKFRETVTYLDEGYYSCTMDGVLLEHNQAFNRMLGFEVNRDLRGTKLPDFWQNPDDRNGYVSQLMTGGVVSNYQINAKTIDGAKIVVMANAHLVNDEMGKPVRIEGAFIDITERKLMEDALKKSEAKYRTLFENAQVGIYRSKLDGSAFLDVNDKFAEIIGFSRRELLGSPGDVRWANPEDRDKMLKQLQEQGGILTNYEAQVIAKNGDVKDVLASIKLYPGEGYLEGTMTDITARKLAEAALREGEERYRMVADYTYDWEYWRAPDGKILYMSPSCERITGYRAGEFMENPGLLDEIIHADDHFLFEQHKSLVQQDESEQKVHEADFRILRRDGKVRWIGHTCLTIRRADGMNMGRRATNRDITERKQAEEALQRSEMLLSEMSRMAKIGAWELDIATMKQEWTDETYVIHDRERGVYDPNSTEELSRFEPGSNELIGKAFEEAIEQGRPYDLEVEMTTVKGNRKWVRAVCVPLLKDGKVTRLSGTVQDITERKQAEETIRSLARFTAENPNPVLRIARDGSLLYGNRAAFEQLAEWKLESGKSAPEVLRSQAVAVLEMQKAITVEISCGKRVFSIAFAPASEGEEVNLYARDVTERTLAEAEIRKLNGELEQRVIERTAQLQTANKQLESELAERKRAEEALRESEERFRHLSEAAFEAIIIDDGGLLLNANNQFSEMFGYEPEELIGKQVMSLTVAADATEAVQKEIATGGVGPYESTGQRKDGTRFPMEIRVREMGYKGRKVRVAAIMDITERKRAEDALRQRTTQLEVANQELEAFAYSVSHDLRAPLRALDGFSTVLLTSYPDKLDEQGRHYLDRLRNASQRMGQLIEDLLDLSRVTRSPLNYQPVDLSALAHEIASDLQLRDPQRKAEFVIAEKMAAQADPHLLRIALQNLLDNAWKFTGPRPQARIEVGQMAAEDLGSQITDNSLSDAAQSTISDQRSAIYFVRDNGVGFDMAYADKLFTPFQRLHSTKEFPGTGIGLATVQRIIARHGGRAWAEAQVDKGATFYFALGGS